MGQRTEEANAKSETSMTNLNTQQVKECHKDIENKLNPSRCVMTEKSEGCFIRLKDAVMAIKDLQTETQENIKMKSGTLQNVKFRKTMMTGRNVL